MRTIYSLAGVLLLSTFGFSQPPVAYYPFTGNANDASANVNHATVIAASLAADRYGTVNNAYDFNGSSGYLRAPDKPQLDFGKGDFSITSFINARKIVTGRIVSAGYTANNGIWGLGFGTHPVWGSGIRINYFIHSGGRYYDFNSAIISRYTAGQWAFIGVTKKGNLLSFYFNGQLTGTAVIPYPSNANSYLTIGARQLTPGSMIEFFNGQIDEVRIYKRALSVNEILELARGTFTQNGLLLAYYPFSGNTRDESQTANHASVIAAKPAPDRNGVINQAYDFNGSNGWIKAPDNAVFDFGTGDFSMAASVNARVIGTGRIVSAGNTSGEGIWGVGFGTHPVWGPGVCINFFVFSGGKYHDFSSAEIKNYKAGQWAWVGLTRSGNTLTFYFNGQSCGTSYFTLPANANSYLSIGSRQSSPGTQIEFFNGKIDEVRLYRGSLTANDMQVLNSGSIK